MDDIKINELYLYTVNTGDLYRKVAQPIMDNLAKKIVNGTYDKTKALIAWQRLADQGAVRYDKEINDGRGSMMWIPKKEREEVAKLIQEHYEEELQEKAEKLKAEKGRKSSLRKPVGRFVKTEKKASVLSRRALLRRRASIRRKAEEDNERKTALIKYLNENEGMNLLDKDIEEVSYDTFEIDKPGWGTAQYVVVTEDEALDYVKSDIEQAIEEDGLDSFTSDFRDTLIEGYLDMDALVQLLKGDINEYVSNLSAQKILKEFDNPRPADYNCSDRTELVEFLREKMIDNMIEDNLEDPVEYFADGVENIGQFLLDNHVLDIDDVIDLAIEMDGVAHFIAYYDDKELDLGDGWYGYRIM